MNMGTGETVAPIGHNGGPSIEEAIETILPDDHENLFIFAQWHVSDYVAGTQGMQLELEGAYIRFLMRLYQRGKALPDDDRFMSTVMNLSIRVWRRVKDALISVGKILIKSGCLTNSRFEKEREKRASQLKKQADAARERWARERAKKEDAKEVSAKFAGSLDETSPKLSENVPEKPNEINAPSVTTHMLTNNYNDIDKKEEDSVPSGTGLSAPSKSLREVVWDEAIGWLRPQAMLNEAKLRTRIGSWMRDYGEAAVLDAVAKAQDKRPVSPMSYIEGILRKAGAPQQTTMQSFAGEEIDRRRKFMNALEKYEDG